MESQNYMYCQPQSNPEYVFVLYTWSITINLFNIAFTDSYKYGLVTIRLVSLDRQSQLYYTNNWFFDGISCRGRQRFLLVSYINEMLMYISMEASQLETILDSLWRTLLVLTSKSNYQWREPHNKLLNTAAD